MDDLYTVKDRRIPREEISSLLWGMGSDISTHSLSMWLKSKTNDEFVVVPRSFCLNSVTLLEEVDYYLEDYGFCNEGDEKSYLTQIENYL